MPDNRIEEIKVRLIRTTPEVWHCGTNGFGTPKIWAEGKKRTLDLPVSIDDALFIALARDDIKYLLHLLEAEVKRRKAAEAVIGSGGAAEYQVVVEAWRRIVKEAQRG